MTVMASQLLSLALVPSVVFPWGAWDHLPVGPGQEADDDGLVWLMGVDVGTCLSTAVGPLRTGDRWESRNTESLSLSRCFLSCSIPFFCSISHFSHDALVFFYVSLALSSPNLSSVWFFHSVYIVFSLNHPFLSFLNSLVIVSCPALSSLLCITPAFSFVLVCHSFSYLCMPILSIDLPNWLCCSGNSLTDSHSR